RCPELTAKKNSFQAAKDLHLSSTERPSRNQNLTAETRRVAPWERTLLACPGCLTPCTQDACPAPPKIPPVSQDVGNNTRPNLNPCPRVEKRKTFIQRG